VEIFDDLVAEQDRLEEILGGLGAAAWATESGAPGWTIADVVLHLAQTEEAVVASVAAGAASGPGSSWRDGDETLDEVIDRQVEAERAAAPVVFARWRAARREAVAALRAADPGVRLLWAATPLKPATLATTRLAEYWAHGLDITGPLGIPFDDTARLRHIAWLGHGTLPYAFALAGEEPGDVYCELTAPDGTTWRFGRPDAASSIRGPAGEFCRVGARRLRPEQTTLRANGPRGEAALAVLRNYAA
jgi:uncharacterized protein (TIGR03084 family)